MSDAAHAPTADLAGVVDNLITDARQMEDQRDAALARVAELQQQVRLWQGDVPLPTLEDCWRVFRTQMDFESFFCRFTTMFDDVALRFVGTVDSYSFPFTTTTVTDGAPFYVFEAPSDYTPGNEFGDSSVSDHFSQKR
jgi:hypothetical protein